MALESLCFRIHLFQTQTLISLSLARSVRLSLNAAGIFKQNMFHICSMGNRKNSRSRSPAKWIHGIPAIVPLCLFILRWFSFPGIVWLRRLHLQNIRAGHW
ncbi:hypothetical protein O6P43_000269 [Quillaja saponaria]|uniref:Uncharacterized protein n=1 Tax=Quillaja saponaria TaxID=32244 RepID=A0AAD7QGL9_QUISA|nr:hypothetical protein O6P43_000269 [Quillaja saponaria]